MLVTFNPFLSSLPFQGGGRTQIARHNLDVFEGGGPGKCQQAFIFLTAFYLQDFIVVGPLTLYGISFIFLKNAGVRSTCPIAFFLKKCKNMKNKCKIVAWRSANICRIAENQKCKLKVCRTPIAWYFQYILHFFCTSFIISTCNIVEGILFLANYWKILELQINVKLDVEGLQIYLLPMENNRIQIKISNGPQKDLKWTFMGSSW